MQIPTTLKHKPVFVAEDYENVDGKYPYEDGSDAKGLSLGLAQWNDRGNVDVSAKVWRYTGEKWSRQSEEMPLHRVLDLAILIMEAELYNRESYRYPKRYDPQHPVISRVPLQGSAMTVKVCTDNPMIDKDMKLFADALSVESEHRLSERYARMAELIDKLGYITKDMKERG